MRKSLLLLLVLLVLLAGCGEKAPQTEPTTPTQGTTGPQEPTVPAVPEHPLTESTGGAVETFVPNRNGFHTAIPFGEDLLLIRQWELVMLEGPDRIPAVTRPQKYDKLFVLPAGVACWMKEEGYILFLNSRLAEAGRLQMPADFTGEPFLTEDGKVLYYSTGSQIYALEMESGISRPVYRSPEKQLVLTDILCDGSVLRCQERVGAERQVRILDARNGEILATGKDYNSLIAEGGGFYVELTQTRIPQVVFGTGDGKMGSIQGLEDGGTRYPMPEQDMLLVVYEREGGLQLDRYDLVSGKRTASLMLPGVSKLWDLRTDEAGKVWFFCDAEDEPLCCWDPEKSPLTEEKLYTQPYFTVENPDEAGLAEMAARAEELADRFGIEILIWEDRPEGLPEDQVFVPEYLVPRYEQYLPVVEKVLNRFPEGFFTQTMEARGGVLRLYLVQQVLGVPEMGTGYRDQGLQLWNGKDSLIVVPLTEDLEQDLYHMLMHVVESRIFAKASSFDRWNNLNPKDFTYENDYTLDPDQVMEAYLTGENRYFIDTFSMSFAKEDRARIFEYACMPGNEEYFRSAAMQTKLKRICEGIRSAFGLNRYQGELIWEQYLK